MTSIERILVWGSGEWQTVVLACGHRRRMRRAEVKTEQLMIGKMVQCAECEGCDSKAKLVLLPGRRK